MQQTKHKNKQIQFTTNAAFVFYDKTTWLYVATS